MQLEEGERSEKSGGALRVGTPNIFIATLIWNMVSESQ